MGNSKTKPEQTDSKEANDDNSTPSLYPQLQIRNCVRNVRNSNNNFSEIFPNEAGASCGRTQSSVYTIDVHNSTPTNFTNPGYVSSEGTVKSPSNDGLPTYEEAIGGVKTPITPIPTAPPSQNHATVEVITEDNPDGSRSRRHRHRRHHHRHHHSDGQNENNEPTAPEEHRRHHHRRGLRKHLAKMNRRHRSETE